MSDLNLSCSRDFLNHSFVATCINKINLLALIIFQRSFMSLLKYFFYYKKIGYNVNVLLQTACLVVNTITVDIFAFLFNSTLAVGPQTPGGGGGYTHFFFIRRLGPSICRSP